jgi:hypothetical protein
MSHFRIQNSIDGTNYVNSITPVVINGTYFDGNGNIVGSTLIDEIKKQILDMKLEIEMLKDDNQYLKDMLDEEFRNVQKDN